MGAWAVVEIFKIKKSDIRVITFQNDKVCIYTVEGNKKILDCNFDSLLIDENKVDIKEINSTIKEISQKGKEKYNLSHQQFCLYSREIPVLIEDVSSCTAYCRYIQKHGRELKIPLNVTMGITSLYNLNDFKFTLAHEFAHYYKYLEIKKINKLEYIMSCIYYLIPTILNVSATLFILTYLKDNLPENYNIIYRISLMLTVIHCIDVYLRSLSYCLFYSLILKSHKEEYLCDKESYSIFPETNLSNTFLSETDPNRNQTSWSHPSHQDRINAIKGYGEKYHRRLSPLIEKKWDGLISISSITTEIYKEIRGSKIVDKVINNIYQTSLAQLFSKK